MGNKIRAKLLSKEKGQQRSEKMAKLRELKKFGKKVQIEVQQKRQKEKKDMMDEMKKVRKGHGGNLDFLDEGGHGEAGERRNIPLLQPRKISKTRNLDSVERNEELKRMTKRVQMMCLVIRDLIKAVALQTRNWARER